MKKKLFSLAALLFLVINVNAQEVEEPDFIGESILVRSDNTFVALEKELTQGRTIKSTGLVLTGIGKVREQIQIKDCCAKVKFSKNDDVKFIIRSVDNLTDPLSIIKIFKFESKKI